MGLSSKRESYTKLAIILGTLIAFGPLSIEKISSSNQRKAILSPVIQDDRHWPIPSVVADPPKGGRRF